MYKDLIGSRVSVVVSSRGDNLMEYVGVMSAVNEEVVELTNVNISYLMLNFQKGIFGNNINTYKTNVSRVIINKKYIISCDV